MICIIYVNEAYKLPSLTKKLLLILVESVTLLIIFTSLRQFRMTQVAQQGVKERTLGK